MQQSPRRLVRLIGTVFAVVSVAVLPGCAANFDSPVMQPYNPGAGINSRIGNNVYALDVLIVADGSGNGTLVAGLVNKARRDDRLVAVEVAANDVSVSMPRPVRLPPENLVQLADEAAVGLSGDGLQPGRMVPVTLRFARAAQVRAQLPIIEAEGAYADVPIEAPPAPGGGA